MENKKTIAIYPFNQKRHSIYNSTIELLKNNYNLIYSPEKSSQNMTFLKLSRNPNIKYFYHKYIRRFLTLNEISSLFRKKEKMEDKYNLIFSSNVVPNLNYDYIIDLENVTALGGYDYNRLNKSKISYDLAGKRCKAIICWNDISRKTLVRTIDCSKFMHKIKVIPFSIKSTKENKISDRNKIRLLFVSSINNPLDFSEKGGIIALETYKRLAEKYDDIEFVIRAHIPKWIKIEYSSLKNIKFIEEFISDEEMKKLFSESDIILEPVPGIQFLLESMNYSLPVIAFDFWMIPEMIINRKNGYLIDSSQIFGDSKDMQNYLKSMHFNLLKLYKKNIDEKIIGEFVKRTSTLIENKRLRIKMGEYAKTLIEKKGRYSLEKRNKEIINIIESALNED